MAINGLTDKEDTIFSIQERTVVQFNYEFNDRYLQSYHMNLSVKTTERSVYNFLMLLGDVGGLFGLLFSVFATLNNVLNFQKAENFLVQSLYRGQKTFEAKKQYAVKEWL